MQYKQRAPLDKFIYGFLASLLATVFGSMFLYVFKFMNNNVSVMQYIDMLKNEPSFKSAVLSLALLANIPLLYYIQQRRLYRAFKGVAVVIIIIGATIVMRKLNILL